MNKIFKKIKIFTKGHKFVAGLVVLALFSAGYGTLKAKSTSAVTHYVLGTVSKGTLAVSVSGTGTVSASNQLDVKAKASGDITSISVRTGEAVSVGGLIASIDSRDALNALQSAELSMKKLVQPSDTDTLVSAEQALSDAQTAQAKAYDDAFNDSGSAVLSLESIVDGMNNMFYTTNGYLSDQNVSPVGTTANGYRQTAGAEFDQAHRALTAIQSKYVSINRSSSPGTLVAFLTDTYNATSAILQAIRDAEVAARYIKTATSNTSDAAGNRAALTLGTNAEASLSGWLTDANTSLTNLKNDQTALQSAPNTISEKSSSLAKIVRGADPLDVQSEQLSLNQKQQAYSDTFVRAPFPGVVGRLNVKKGDSVSSGAVIATLISKDKIATVSLNEVDAAKVKVGDKATLTFDAVDGLTLTGTVSDIDLIGTVTQGVVNYTAKISFDEDDPRVLSGMSVSASIITQVKNDILVVPLGAIKNDSQGSYVLRVLPAVTTTGGTQGVVLATPPVATSVETGLSNDTQIEITSGLAEGDQVVARTISPSATTATTQAPSLFGGGARGGGTRALGR